MTVEQVINGVIYAGALAGALAGIGLFLHWALVRPLRAFLRREIATPLAAIEKALETNTSETKTLGRQLADHLREADDRDARIEEISRRLSEHTANGGHTTRRD